MPKVLREALRRSLDQRLTFAAFRIPGRHVELWAQRSPELEQVDGSLLWELNEAFIVAPFALDQERIPFLRADVELAFGEIAPDLELLDDCAGSAIAPPWSFPAATSKENYTRNILNAQQAMATSGLQKVVLSKVITAATPELRSIDLFLLALEEQKEAFVALVHTPDHGLWLGASPERLVHEEEDRITVDALAGTRRSSAGSTPMDWGAKEQDEQRLVADAVTEVFRELRLKNVNVTGPEVVHTANMMHLRTRLDADLAERDLGEVVLALHPTPAVCGTPRNAAAAFLRTAETHERQLYAGFWGPWNPDGVTDLYVNIRCMHLRNDHAALFTGAGITAASNAESEWNETEEKGRAWLERIARMNA
jgi:isochorismate synthase